jgi:hypothetical protein
MKSFGNHSRFVATAVRGFNPKGEIMKPAVTRFAVTMGIVLVATVLTGNAFAECSAFTKIKPSALLMPQGRQSATFLTVSTSDGGAPIVGLWNVHYSSTVGGPSFQSYQQFHSDGLEIETPEFAPGVCMGTWKQTNLPRTVKIFHVGFTQGAPPGTFRFELRELDTVSPDRKSFEGVYDQKFFDKDGNLVLEDKGTLQATRLSVNQF